MIRATRSGHARRSVAVVPLLLLGLPALVFAQGRGDPAAMQERMNAEIDLVIEQLELSEDEAEVTRTVLEEGAQQRVALMREMRSSGQMDRHAMGEVLAQADLATEEMLAEFLDEEKMQAYREYREKRRAELREQRGQGQRRRQGGGP